jgi:hypothetical protein
MNVGSRFWFDVAGVLLLLTICLPSCSEDYHLHDRCDPAKRSSCGESLHCFEFKCTSEPDPFWLPGDPLCTIEDESRDLDFFEEDCEKIQSKSKDNHWLCYRGGCTGPSVTVNID